MGNPSPSENNQSHPFYRYAAIDIGSNAVRLLFSYVTETENETNFKKSELIRLPIRLGEDAFQFGKIEKFKAEQFKKSMQAFKLLIDVFNPIAYRACATASLREASNGLELTNQVYNECKLKIDIIDGKEEAELIYANHIEKHLDKNSCYLYIDVGGGSTEVTLFDKGICIVSQSFEIGTLRWLKGQVPKSLWYDFKDWVKAISVNHAPLTAIGSGGNINKIFKMLGRKGKPLSYLKLRELYEEMKLHTIENRMEIWGLNPDRADVIVPAFKIFLSVMKSASISEIIVPQIGLSDGIIHQLHEHHLQSLSV